MKRRVLITLGLFVAMISFIACNNDDPKPDPDPKPDSKPAPEMTVSYCIESSSVNQEPERKYIFDFNIKDYGWVTYNIPEGIEVLSQTQNTEWNMAFDYPYIITNSVDFILYNPPVYLCDIISGYILLKIPKAIIETVVNYKTVQYQLYE